MQDGGGTPQSSESASSVNGANSAVSETEKENTRAVGARTAEAEEISLSKTPAKITGKPADAHFNENVANFSIDLFKQCVSYDKNTLISPLSVTLALAIAANGADGETLAQMENMLGGDIPLGALNEYLYTYVQKLPNELKSKLNIANSIWLNKGHFIQVKDSFLQTNADYYGASVFKAYFDQQTLNDINGWVSDKTDKMIKKILNDISGDAVAYLINAIAFDSEWRRTYLTNDIAPGTFTDISKKGRAIEFMNSCERMYLDDGSAKGFVKPYFNDNYSFVALLPNEDVPIDKYMQSMTGAGFLYLLKNAENAIVDAYLPKFEFEYEIIMNDALKASGMRNAFDIAAAEFYNMAEFKPENNVYIDFVLHKTFIAVDELGTKAGAATVVAITAASAPGHSDMIVIRLDRPFVFAIIDNSSGLPVFIGAVMSI